MLEETSRVSEHWHCQSVIYFQTILVQLSGCKVTHYKKNTKNFKSQDPVINKMTMFTRVGSQSPAFSLRNNL